MITDLSISTKPPTEAENETLYQRIKRGDKAAITEMIERNVPGVLSRVGSFIGKYPKYKHLQDDLVSTGLMSLTKTVNGFTDIVLEGHPNGRIVYEIDVALGHYVDEEVAGGTLSDRTIRRRRERQHTLPNRLDFDINQPPVNIWNKADGRVIKKTITDENSAGAESDTSADIADQSLQTNQVRILGADARQLVKHYTQGDATANNDLLEEIHACCECDEDKMIVDLRTKGYTDAEIGEQLSISRQTVQVRRQEIEARFAERQL